MSEKPVDPRPARTRDAIIGSFNEMLLSQPLDSIKVPRIIDEAGVGRSTFYEHFRNTDELLRESSTAILAVLADAATPRASRDRVRHVVTHVRDNRAFAVELLQGERLDQLARRLSELIEQRIDTAGSRLTIPARLLAAQIAGAQLALVREWLHALSPCTDETLADTLIASSKALAASGCVPYA